MVFQIKDKFDVYFKNLLCSVEIETHPGLFSIFSAPQYLQNADAPFGRG